MNKISSIAATIALMCTMSVSAQRLTLEECVDMALENNARILKADYSVRASRETSREAFTNYFPSVSATGAAFTANHGMLQHSFNLPLSMLGIGLDDIDFNLSLLKKGSVAGLNLVQPIFLGGRIVNGNRLARVGEEVSLLQRRQAADEVKSTVEQYYWQLVSLHSRRQTLENVIAMLDTLTTQVQSYVDAGVTTTNDLLQVKLKRNEMLVARSELDNGISVLRMLLSQYVGKGTSGTIDVATEIPMGTVPDFPADIYMKPEDCLGMTVGYGLLTSNVKAKELEQKMAVGNNLPVVAAGASYTYEHLLDQGHTFANLYVTLTVPITDWWGGSHNMKKKKLETQIARTQLEDDSQLLMIAMINAWNDLTTSYTQMQIAKESIAQSTENLRLNRNYYDAGTVTITDLLDAQTLHMQSQDKFVDAYGQFQIKKLAYLQATGR